MMTDEHETPDETAARIMADLLSPPLAARYRLAWLNEETEEQGHGMVSGDLSTLLALAEWGNKAYPHMKYEVVAAA